MDKGMFTRTERAVMALVAECKSNEEIVKALGFQLNTIQTKLTEIYYDPKIETKHTNVGGVAHLGLGYGGCALPLVLDHNTPNNAVALLWAETDGGQKDSVMLPAMRRPCSFQRARLILRRDSESAQRQDQSTHGNLRLRCRSCHPTARTSDDRCPDLSVGPNPVENRV